MFRTLKPSAIKEMEEVGDISITIKAGWEASGLWSSIPANINYWLGTECETVFSCYYTRDQTTVNLSRLIAAEIISKEKSLVDAYLFVALKGLIKNVKTMRLKRLIIDSYIPSIVDHMLDLEFTIIPIGSFNSSGSRGCKILEE